MIHLLSGDNVYARDQAVRELVAEGEAEVYEADALDSGRLADIFTGSTLFATERVIVIRGLAATPLWSDIVPWCERADAASSYILVDDAVDKRTAAYKWLKANADVLEYTLPTARDAGQLRTWLIEIAQQHNVSLSTALANEMIDRATRPSERDNKPVIDQQQLANVIDQLDGVREVTRDIIDTVMPASTTANVFGLLEAALDGDAAKTQALIGRLKASADGYMTLGLLATQVTGLAALAVAGDRSVDDVAHDTGLNAYGLRSLSRYARRLNHTHIRAIVQALALADERTKRGQHPWQEIETALVKVASAVRQ